MSRAHQEATPIPLTRRLQWHALQRHSQELGQRHLRELFVADPARGDKLQAEAAGLYIDYSKQRVTSETLRLLMKLASACGLNERIAAMFRGDKINETEIRCLVAVSSG